MRGLMKVEFISKIVFFILRCYSQSRQKNVETINEATYQPALSRSVRKSITLVWSPSCHSVQLYCLPNGLFHACLYLKIGT